MTGEQTNEAETLALEALGWVLADDARAERLLALTGLTPEGVRTRVQERDFLAAVLRFLENHEPDLVACAELDPPRFQAETLALLQRRLAEKGALPRACIASGHNHHSMAVHLGAKGDTRLADEILSFVADCAGAGA